MNASLLYKPSTQRHIATLRAEGHTVVDPLEDSVYEMSFRRVVLGPAILPPHLLTEVIVKWLEDRIESDDSVSV